MYCIKAVQYNLSTAQTYSTYSKYTTVQCPEALWVVPWFDPITRPACVNISLQSHKFDKLCNWAHILHNHHLLCHKFFFFSFFFMFSLCRSLCSVHKKFCFQLHDGVGHHSLFINEMCTTCKTHSCNVHTYLYNVAALHTTKP